jgi:hypothetical protein
MNAHRLSQLSPARQTLVRLLQRVNFGELQNIRIQDGEPVFESTALTVLDVKLDKDEVPRLEIGLSDFALNAEVSRLMARLDEFQSGVIQRLEVRSGVPRRLIVALETISHLIDSEISSLDRRHGRSLRRIPQTKEV